jgi:ATP-binding cassette, subfamily F, member 1
MTINISVKDYDLQIAGKKLLKGANLVVARGHRYGLIGKNGSGKTTLLKDLLGMNIKDHYLVSQELEDTDTSVYDSILSKHTELWDLKHKITDFDDLDEMTDDQLEKYTKSSEVWHTNGFEQKERELHRILHGLGFTDTAAPVSSFSGGWRMRVSLASALFICPPLLLLDEPTNHLDLNGIVWLINYLSEHWSGTLMVVSHDMEFLDVVCTDIINLWDQGLHYYSGKKTVYSNFIKMFTQELKEKRDTWIKYTKKLKEFKGQGKGKTANETFIKKFYIEEPLYERPPKIDIASVPDIGTPVLTVSDITFSYPGTDKLLIKNVEFGMDLKSRYTIVGANGVGKSTLLKLMAGKLKPTSGDVHQNGHLRIGYYHQHSQDALPMDICAAAYLMKVNTKLHEQDARKWLGKIGLPGKAHLHLISTLSGGQKSRVALVAVLLTEPHILLLDEPTNHLDMETIQILIEALNNYEGGLVTITHDINLINATESVLLCLHDGKLTETDYDTYREMILEAE